MAYRKTANVLTQLQAQKDLIVSAAINIIGRDGWTALTAKAVVERSGGSMGKLYNHFPDMAELLAQVEATVMHRDRGIMERAADETKQDVTMVVAALAAMFDIFCTKPVSREMMSHSEAYRDTLTRSLGHIIGVSGLAPRSEARDCARAALGAVFGMAPASGPRAVRFSRAILFILRGLGVPERKAMELAS